MADESRGKRRKQANPRRKQVDVEKLTAVDTDGEDEGGGAWGAETSETHEKNSLTTSEGTESGSPTHCANAKSLSPAPSWTGGPQHTSIPGEGEGDLMIYSQDSDPRAAEEVADYDFLPQLRQALTPARGPDPPAQNGILTIRHPAHPANEDTRWSPGKQGSPDRQDEPSGSPDALRFPLACPFCQRTYRRSAALREHVRFCQERDCSGRLVCPLCGYIAPYRAQLERHVAAHSLAQSKNPSMYDPAAENRKFKCVQCGKAFKYKHHLKEHLRIHSGEKPYECANCKKRFSHSGSYSSHLSSKKCLSSGGGLNGQVYASYHSGSSPGSPPAGNGRNSGKGSPYAFHCPRAPLDRVGPGQPEPGVLEPTRLVQNQELQGLWDPTSEFYRPDLFKYTSLLPYLHSADKFGHVLQEMLRRDGAHGEGVETKGEGSEAGAGAGPTGDGVTCRWCLQLFPNRAVLIQHERYLCRMNREAVEVLQPTSSHGRAATHQSNGFGRERSPIHHAAWPSPLPQRSPIFQLHPRSLWSAQEAGSPTHHPTSPASPSFSERRLQGTPRRFGSPLCLDRSALASSPSDRPTPPRGTPSSAGSQNEPLDLSLPKPRGTPGEDRPCNGALSPLESRKPVLPLPYSGIPMYGSPLYSALPLFNPIMHQAGPLRGGLSPLALNPPTQNSAPFLQPLSYKESDAESFLKWVHQERHKVMGKVVSGGRLDYLSLMEDGAELEGLTGRKKLKKTDDGLYACDICDKTFQKSSSLLRHKYEHTGRRPHECKICSKAFKHKHHLIEHSRLHSGEKPYQCDKCGKRFSHSGSYSQHMNHRYAYCGHDNDPNDPDDNSAPLGASLDLGGAAQEVGIRREVGPGFLTDSSLDRRQRREGEQEEGEELRQRWAGPGAGGALMDRSPVTNGEGLRSEGRSGEGLDTGGIGEGREGSPQRDRGPDCLDGDRGTG